MLFDFIFSNGKREERIRKEAFESGYKAGEEMGIILGMAKNFEKSRELSEEEYKEVIDFLIKRDLELCCYDINKGGFRVRKKLNYE